MDTNHTFSADNTYLFGYNYNGGEPNEVIAEKPTSIDVEKILFVFSKGHKSLSEYIKVQDIVAVGNNELGTIKILGWSGKFQIINQQKFDELVKSGAIELKK